LINISLEKGIKNPKGKEKKHQQTSKATTPDDVTFL